MKHYIYIYDYRTNQVYTIQKIITIYQRGIQVKLNAPNRQRDSINDLWLKKHI